MNKLNLKTEVNKSENKLKKCNRASETYRTSIHIMKDLTFMLWVPEGEEKDYKAEKKSIPANNGWKKCKGHKPANSKNWESPKQYKLKEIHAKT